MSARRATARCRADGPARVVAARTIGRGAAAFLSSFEAATVVGTFRHGFYLAGADDVIAVVDTTISPGPLYIRHHGPLQRASTNDRPEVGARVEIAGGDILGAGWQLSTAEAGLFAPTLPETLSGARLLQLIEAAVPPDLVRVWAAVEERARSGDVPAVGDLLSGLGRGLTPEGDDVLAGAYLVWSIRRIARPQLVAVAETSRTTNLSRAFLRWAAVGECIDEVHQLLSAADRGAWSEFVAAQARLRAIGGTTGEAMLAGIRLAASCGPIADRRREPRNGSWSPH